MDLLNDLTPAELAEVEAEVKRLADEKAAARRETEELLAQLDAPEEPWATRKARLVAAVLAEEKAARMAAEEQERKFRRARVEVQIACNPHRR